MSSTEVELEAQLDAELALSAMIKDRDAMIAERTANLPANVPKRRKEIKAAEGSKMKSDLKKSTAYVKKIKSINTEGLQQCIRDAETLNLNLYISEIVTALLEVNFKATDVGGIVKLCGALHLRYEEFTPALTGGLRDFTMRLFLPGAVTGAADDLARQRRVLLRLCVEVYQLGLMNDADFFVRLLALIIGKGRGGASKQPMDLSSLSVFVKCGAESLFGKLPRKVHQLLHTAGKAGDPVFAAAVNRQLTPPNVSVELNAQVDEAYEQLTTDLLKWHKKLQAVEKRLDKERAIAGGTLSDAKQSELDQTRRIYERIFATVTAIAEALGLDVPVLEADEADEDGKAGISVWESAGSSAHSGGPYGDSETRAFYEDLPDLLTMVPLAALGLTAEQAAAMKETWRVNKDRQMLGSAAPGAAEGSGGAVAGAGAGAGAGGGVPGGVSLSNIINNVDNMLQESEEAMLTKLQLVDAPIPPPVVGSAVAQPAGDDKAVTAEGGAGAGGAASAPASEEGATQGNKLLLLLQEKLPECSSRARADEFCVAFAYISTKNARRKLVQALYKIPRTRFELIPQYARIAASLSRLFPEVGPALVECLFSEFYGIYKAKTALFLENKIKNIRYIGELIKFGVAAPIVFFNVTNLLLKDFRGHNVDIFAALLESCGRYLFFLPHTNARVCGVIDSMLRLRRHRNLDLRQQTLLESAYFSVKPPERAAIKKKEYTKVQLYIHHLFHRRLGTASLSVDALIRLLRKLPWEEEMKVGKQKGGGGKHAAAAPVAPAPTPAAAAAPEGEAGGEGGEASAAPAAPALHNVEQTVVKACLKVSRAKYVNTPLVADCISGLAKYRPGTLVALTDRVLEEIQRALEMPHKREPQRTLGCVRLLGELYNYTAVSSSIVFDTLYRIISFGHEVYAGTGAVEAATSTGAGGGAGAGAGAGAAQRGDSAGGAGSDGAPVVGFDPSVPSQYDPPGDFFRVQLVAELVNAVGQYFTSGVLKERLTAFLTYFQRYLLAKCGALPLHVEFAVLDMMDAVEEHAREALLKKLTKAAEAEALAAAKLAAKSGRAAKNRPPQRGSSALGQSDAVVVSLPREFLFPRFSSLAAVEAAVAQLEAVHPNPALTAAVVGVGAGDAAEGGPGEVGEGEGEEEAVGRREEGDDSDASSEGGSSDGSDSESESGDSDTDSDSDSDSDSGSGSDSDSDSDDATSCSEDEDEEEPENEVEAEIRRAREEATAAHRQRCAEEEDEFDRAFRGVMQDSIETAQVLAQQARVDMGNMAIPAVIPRPKNVAPTSIAPPPTRRPPASLGLAEGEGEDDDDSDDDDQPPLLPPHSSRGGAMGGRAGAPKAAPPKVAFKLLSRDARGRVESRELLVPKDNTMVVRLQKQEAAAREEKQRMKEIVLQLGANAMSGAGGDGEPTLHDLYGNPRAAEEAAAGGGGGNRASGGTGGAGFTRGGLYGRFARQEPKPAPQASGSGGSSSSSASTPAGGPPASVNNTIVKSTATERVRATYTGGRKDETHKAADTLNLDEFLAASTRTEYVPRKAAPVGSGGQGGKGGAAKSKQDLDANEYLGL